MEKSDEEAGAARPAQLAAHVPAAENRAGLDAQKDQGKGDGSERDASAKAMAMTEGSERIIDLYRRHANAWATKRANQPGRLMEALWLDRFLRLLPQHPTVLDIGCGSGEPIARYLAESGCDLTGVDSAPEMISLCAARFPQQNWRVADMRSLTLGRTFDGIVAWDSFFHLTSDDQRQMFPIFRAHAAAGAALMFTSGPSHGEAIGVFEGEPLYHASLASDEYRDLLAQHGFAVVAHEVEDPACGKHTVWLAQAT